MLEWLQSFIREYFLEKPWKPVSRPALAAWLIFYAAFLAYAFRADGGFLFIDSANLVVHEGGHNLFGWFGPTLGLWGGTLLELGRNHGNLHRFHRSVPRFYCRVGICCVNGKVNGPTVAGPTTAQF